MEISAILIGLGALGVSIPFVINPFRQRQLTGAKKSEARDEDSRVAALSALRDLDFDYRVGKVGDEDYSALRVQLVADAAQHIQRQVEEEEKLEALIQARRASQGSKCEQCGASLEAGQRFCSKCGEPANSVVCPSCGKKVRAGDLFCPSCGIRVGLQVEAVGQS